MNESIPDDKLRALLNVVVNKWFAKWASRAGKLTEQEWDMCFSEAVRISEQGAKYPIVVKLMMAFLEELDARWRGGSYPEYDPGCGHAGVPEADCPLWVCKHPELECKDCDILKEYVEAYRKGGPDEH